MEASKSKAIAFLLSAVLTITIIGCMIVLNEQIPAFKTFLNSLTGHHWVTKGVFAAILFPLFAAISLFVLRFEKARKTLKADNIYAWSLALVAVTTLFFFASLINYIINFIFH